jgi:hypothetical protein
MIGLQTTHCAEPLPLPSVAAVTLGSDPLFFFQCATPASARCHYFQPGDLRH